MNKKYYSLGDSDTGGFGRITRIIFGLVCIAVAIFWLIISPVPIKSAGTLWITVIFMIGFGAYQIWSGLGKAKRFIEISDKSIRLKKNSVLSPVEMDSSDIEKIEIFPMNVIFILKSGKKVMLRFGASYQETNETIKDEILAFSDANNIPAEIIEEKI